MSKGFSYFQMIQEQNNVNFVVTLTVLFGGISYCVTKQKPLQGKNQWKSKGLSYCRFPDITSF
jgi:hypothetical protein